MQIPVAELKPNELPGKKGDPGLAPPLPAGGRLPEPGSFWKFADQALTPGSSAACIAEECVTTM
jgi:hypothetical protein